MNTVLAAICVLANVFVFIHFSFREWQRVKRLELTERQIRNTTTCIIDLYGKHAILLEQIGLLKQRLETLTDKQERLIN